MACRSRAPEARPPSAGAPRATGYARPDGVLPDPYRRRKCFASWKPRRSASRTASSSSGSASPATGSRYENVDDPRRPVRLARAAPHAAAAPARAARRRRRSPGTSARPAPVAGILDRPHPLGPRRRRARPRPALRRADVRQRLARAAHATARPAQRRRRAAQALRARAVRGQFHAEPSLEVAVRAQGAVRRAAHVRGRPRAEPRGVQVRRGVRDPDRGRGDRALSPGQRRPRRRASCGTSRWTCSSRA